MSSTPSSGAAGALLVIVGVVLLAQTLKGGLVDRVLGSGSPSSSSATGSSSATPSSSPDSPQGNLSTNPAPNPGSTATPGTQASGGYLPYIPPSGEKRMPAPSGAPTPQNQGNPTSPPAPY